MFKSRLLLILLLFSFFTPIISFGLHLNCESCQEKVQHKQKISCTTPENIPHEYDFDHLQIEIHSENKTTPLKKPALDAKCACCITNDNLEPPNDKFLISRNKIQHDLAITSIITSKIIWNFKITSYKIALPNRAPPYFSNLKSIRLLC